MSKQIIYGKRSKYKAVKTVVDDITFDSKKEAKRYGELKMMEKAGLISDLLLQPGFVIFIKGKKICEYRADFEYWEQGQRVIEDVKSETTRKLPVYRLKKKMFEAAYGIKIKET